MHISTHCDRFLTNRSPPAAIAGSLPPSGREGDHEVVEGAGGRKRKHVAMHGTIVCLLLSVIEYALLIHRFAVPLPRWGRHFIVDPFGTYGNGAFANAQTNLQHPACHPFRNATAPILCAACVARRRSKRLFWDGVRQSDTFRLR